MGCYQKAGSPPAGSCGRFQVEEGSARRQQNLFFLLQTFHFRAVSGSQQNRAAVRASTRPHRGWAAGSGGWGEGRVPTPDAPGATCREVCADALWAVRHISMAASALVPWWIMGTGPMSQALKNF